MAQTVTVVSGQHADVTDLATGLAALWRQIDADDDTPLCRSLTVNLIALADAQHEPLLDEAILAVLCRHPCRAFRVVLDPGADELRAELGARIARVGTTRQTCLEEIRLRAAQSQMARVPGVLRPLIVNDLPVHLFWAGPLPDNPAILAALIELADQVVVDSALFDDPIRDLARLDELGADPLVDLVSFRTRPWRRALAEAFEKFDWQPNPSTVAVVRHGGDRGAIAAGCQLAGWLRERLGARVSLEPVDPEAPAPEPPGQPHSLSLKHDDVDIRIEHAITAPTLSVHVTLGDRCLLPFEITATRAGLGDLLAAALDTLP